MNIPDMTTQELLDLFDEILAELNNRDDTWIPFEDRDGEAG